MLGMLFRMWPIGTLTASSTLLEESRRYIHKSTILVVKISTNYAKMSRNATSNFDGLRGQHYFVPA